MQYFHESKYPAAEKLGNELKCSQQLLRRNTTSGGYCCIWVLHNVLKNASGEEIFYNKQHITDPNWEPHHVKSGLFTTIDGMTW